MRNNLIYDIRTQESARRTLELFTGIAWQEWVNNSNRIVDFEYEDFFISTMLVEHDIVLPQFGDITFVFSHITTSGNGCKSIAKHGLYDLVNSYKCVDSDMRKFLSNHGVYIDIMKKEIKHRGKTIDISYNPYVHIPYYDTEAYYASRIGRKIYYDFTICGFLHIDCNRPYGGEVHFVPEIISDIDNLLKGGLCDAWLQETRAYEIVVKVNGNEIVIDAIQGCEREQLIAYLLRAYYVACGDESETIVLLKNGVQITVNNIIEIKEFNDWYGK